MCQIEDQNIDLSCSKKTLGSFKKYVHSKLQIFDLLPLVHPCSFYMQDAYEFLNEKLRSEKREKNYFFCKLNIKDGNVFYTDIYTITTIKIFTCSYIKKSLKKCLRRFNKTFSNYQATYQKELYLLFEKSGNILLKFCRKFAERKQKMNSLNLKY